MSNQYLSFAESIEAIRSVINDGGQSTLEAAIKVHGEWHFLPLQALVNGRVEPLVEVAHKLGFNNDLDTTKLKELGKHIARRARKKLLVFKREGYRRFHLGGELFECLIWRGDCHWISNTPKASVACMTSSTAVPAASCSLEDWQSTIGSALSGNPYLIVGMGAALAPLITARLSLSPLALILVGESSSGKSATQSILQSVIQPGNPLTSFSGTKVGIQQFWSRYSDRPLFLQESRQMPLHQLIELLFDLGNNAARIVGAADQVAVEGDALNLSVIASNERFLDEMQNNKFVQFDAGLRARVMELMAPRGLFETIPEGMKTAAYVEQLVLMSEQHYGIVWDVWVKKVATRLDDICTVGKKVLPKRRAALAAAAEITDPIGLRLIGAYAGWEYAACLASKFHILPLSVKEIKSAFRQVLIEHQARLKVGRTPQDEKIIDLLRGSLDENLMQFPPLSSVTDSPSRKSWGYSHAFKGEEYFLWFPSALENVSSAYGRRETISALRRNNLLKANTKAGTLSVRIPGERLQKRFYAIKKSIRFDG